MSEQNSRLEIDQKGEVQYLFVGNKAGLDGVDKEKITKIINDTTQTSEFYKRQQVKRQQYDERIKEMIASIEQAKQDPIKLLKLKQESDEKIEQLKQSLQLDRVWVHFDMDMFYVACELKDRPELKDLPVAVGGMSMICTANYVARKYGVRSAMPGFIGKKLCPQLILIPCNFDKYRKASNIFKKVLYQYDANLESMGLDEANLDLTDYLLQNDITTDAQIYDICNQIRKQVNDQTGGLTCSCGIGPNKMIAKICSDMNKPNGQFQLINDEDKVMDFMKDLPIRKIPGIGNVTEQLLKGIGIEKCSQILERIIDIKICFRDLSFDHLVSSALGIGRSQHEEESDKKSISVSRTFSQISTIEEIHEKIRQISQMLSDDAVEEQKVGKHLAITFKTIYYQTRSKNRMIGRYFQDAESIEKIAKELMKELLPTEPLRLIGLRLSQLADENEIKKSGLDKYFGKDEKNNNESILQPKRKSSKQSKNVSQLSIKTIFNDKLQSEKSISLHSAFDKDNKQIKQLEMNTVESKQQPFLKQTQPIFLNLIDKYESHETSCDDDSDDDDASENYQLQNNHNLIIQKQINSKRKSLNNSHTFIDQNDKDSSQNNDDDEGNEDDDDDDDMVYLKKILNKNISDRLSQICEKKSQEEQQQSNHQHTPQFIMQDQKSQILKNNIQCQRNQQQMIPEIQLELEQVQSQYNQQTQYFQRKQNDPIDNKMHDFSEFQKIQPQEEILQIESPHKRTSQNLSTNNNNQKQMRDCDNQVDCVVQRQQNQLNTQNNQQNQQQIQQNRYDLEISGGKKRKPVESLTPMQIEEQLKLKKQFIPRLFECPICFQQIDSYGNVTLVNTHITDCMRIQEDKLIIATAQSQNQAIQSSKSGVNQQQKTHPASIFNRLPDKQNRNNKQNDQQHLKKSSKKKSQPITHTLDSFITKQNS